MARHDQDVAEWLGRIVEEEGAEFGVAKLRSFAEAGAEYLAVEKWLIREET